MLCWALNFITVKGTGEQIPPMTFAWVRFTTAAVILLALLRWREGRVGLSRADILPVAVLGVIGFGIYQMLWASAIQLISAGDSALLIATTPVLAALIAVAFGHDTLTRGKLAGALIAFAGVALVVGPELSADDGSALLGYAVTLVAAICWAAYVAFSPPILRHSSPLRMATWVLAAGSLTLMPAGILASTTADWSRVTPLAWAGLVYSAVLAAGLSNIVMFEGIRVLGPARASVFQFLVPFFAVVIGAVALGDPIRVGQLVGGVVIVSGVLLTRSRWRSWRTAAGGVRP
jgi:drug/metabolite transporter (DMT)-like permease